MPGKAASEPAGPDEDYWDGDDAGQFAGLVYPAREASAEPSAAPGDGSGDNGEHFASDDAGAGNRAPTQPMEIPEIDEDAPPFATAPFATIQHLNRVRSMPVPPEDEEEE
jgi:hypothetical protein